MAGEVNESVHEELSVLEVIKADDAIRDAYRTLGRLLVTTEQSPDSHAYTPEFVDDGLTSMYGVRIK